MTDMTSNRWKQIKELFATAVEMTPAERSTFLACIADRDQSVIAELERLLHQREHIGDFLESNSRDWPTRMFEFHTFIADDLVSDRFRIVRFIGRGGMGEVYEAEDKALGRNIALKTIRPEIALDQRVIARFMQEIQLALKVTHPNVCRVHDIGHDKRSSEGIEGEITYLTMELLPGLNLAERLRSSGRMSTQEALPIVRQIADGLRAAHEIGIVHGDLKSSNVVLASTENSGYRAVVTDFGLARLVSTTTSETAHSIGATGTPAYMSPEQVVCGKVTTASDIYSLGVIMFEMVTGTLPFTADTPTSIANKRLEEDAPTPRSIVSYLDSKWDHAIIKCLKRDPEDRFQSAMEIVDSLQPRTRLLLRHTSRKFALGAAAFVLSVPIAFGCYHFWRISTPEHKVKLAEALIRQGLEHQNTAEPHAAEASFEEARHLYQSAGNMAGVSEALTKEGDLFTDEGDFVRARSNYESALAIAHNSGDQQRAGVVLANLGFMLGRQGDIVGKRKNYESALEVFRKIDDKRHIATILKNLGNLESGANSTTRYEQALTIFKEIGYRPGAASTLDDLGVELDASGYLAAARKAFEEELSMWREVSDKSFAGAPILAKFNLGCVLDEQGHLSEGRQQFEDSFRLTKELKGSVPPGALYVFGQLLLDQGELAEARRVTEEALALAYKSGNHEDIGGARLTIAKVALEEGHAPEAESQARQALEQFQLQNQSLNQSRAAAVLAVALVAQQKFREARNTLRTTVVPAVKNEPICGERLSLMITVARILSRTGDIHQGLKYLNAAIEDSKRLGYLGYELEARMVWAETDLRSGRSKQASASLASIEKDAKANGFQLIARKAERAMQFGSGL
jgi:serine/threonine protein kinase